MFFLFSLLLTSTSRCEVFKSSNVSIQALDTSVLFQGVMRYVKLFYIYGREDQEHYVSAVCQKSKFYDIVT